jgi:hypothetical protein
MPTLAAVLLAAAPLTTGADLARSLGQRITVEGVLERVEVMKGQGAWQGTGIVLDDDTVLYVTYGAPPEGWEPHVGHVIRVEGLLHPSISERAQSLIAPHLREPGTPQRQTRKASSAVGQRVHLVGVARDAKGGAVLLVENEPVYLAGLDAWPAEAQGKRVAVSGSLTLTQHLPEAGRDAKGAAAAGAKGKQLVLERPTWRLVDAP